jgi:hypothetical protein
MAGRRLHSVPVNATELASPITNSQSPFFACRLPHAIAATIADATEAAEGPWHRLTVLYPGFVRTRFPAIPDQGQIS